MFALKLIAAGCLSVAKTLCGLICQSPTGPINVLGSFKPES